MAISRNVRWVSVHGRVILLDLRDGEYALLDEAATFLWELMCSDVPGDELAAALAARFDIAVGRSQSDVQDFVESCDSRGWLAARKQSETPRVAVRSAHQSRSFARAWWCIRAVRRSLNHRGFPDTYRESLQLSHTSEVARHAEVREVADALDSFRLAENCFTVRNADVDCLPRSLALHRFLTLGGIGVEHVIGVRRYPFGAHAWVELNGTPIYDSATFVSKYTPLARIAACGTL